MKGNVKYWVASAQRLLSSNALHSVPTWVCRIYYLLMCMALCVDSRVELKGAHAEHC